MKSVGVRHGLATVEFAIIGMIAMVVLFAVFEIARVFFVYNMLEEATRRGARLAAVCVLNDPAVREIAVFNGSGGGANSTAGAGPFDRKRRNLLSERCWGCVADPVGNYGDIAYVRARIVNFQHQLLIPLFMSTFTTPHVLDDAAAGEPGCVEGWNHAVLKDH